MNHILVNTLAVAVVLGVIVFVHELGHFLAAKSFGVRVETFSLGFGKRLLGVRYGGTDYRISLLPIGGYVKMAGENPVEAREGQADEFLSKPRWQRFIIAVAGPFMNAVLAIGLLIPAYMRAFPHDSVLDSPAVVATVEPGSPAAQAGIQPLDRIVKIDGVQDPTWEQVLMQTAVSVDHSIGVTLSRNGRLVDSRITPRSPSSEEDPPITGLTAEEKTILGPITAASPAQRGGLRLGDQVETLNGAQVLNPEDLILKIQASQTQLSQTKDVAVGSPGQPMQVGILRGGAPLHLAVTPNRQDFATDQHWMIGAAFTDTTVMVKLPFRQALNQSLAENKQYSQLIVDLVGKLITRQASMSAVQSPIGIASIAGDAARQSSLVPLVEFTSMISLNLGILNLLPIPVLDGGMILFLFIEGVLRHEISLRVKERVYQAGFAFLLIIMSVAVYNDILRAIVVKH